MTYSNGKHDAAAGWDETSDPLLDAALEEVLGGVSPPDLTSQIMSALDQVKRNQTASDQRITGQQIPSPPLPGVPLPEKPAAGKTPDNVQPLAGSNTSAPRIPVTPRSIPTPPPLPKPVPAAHANGNGSDRDRRRRKSSEETTAAAAASIGALVSVKAAKAAAVPAINWWSYVTASAITVAVLSASVGGVAYVKYGPHTKDTTVAVDPQPGATPSDGVVAPAPAPGIERQPSAPGQPDGPRGARPKPGKATFAADGGARPQPQPAPEFKPRNPAAPSEPALQQDIVQFINTTLVASWEDANVKPSQQATSTEWCRRVYLRIAGRIPSVEELQAYANDKSPDRREKMVDKLLASEDYAINWSTILTNAMIGRTGGDDADLADREQLRQYIEKSLAAGKSYRHITHEMLSATGSNDSQAEDYNPAANFLLSGYDDQAVHATAQASRMFLGQNLRCVQCHDHPANDWKQHDFWQLNAFFRQTKVEKIKGGKARLVTTDFTGDHDEDGEAGVFYEQLNGEVRIAFPQFNDYAAPRSGEVSVYDRREAVATLIADSNRLAPVLVNRVWAHFFGYGFTDPVDDMGPHNPPTHPALLQRVADEFAASNYDVRALVRWIALSDAFQLSSRITSDNIADAPSTGDAPLFSHYYARQMQPEQMFQSLQVAADGLEDKSKKPKSKTQPGVAALARSSFASQFMKKMGTDEGDEHNMFDGSIRQSLTIMHSPLMQRATSKDKGDMLNRLANSKMSRAEQIEHLFLAAVARQPTKAERNMAAKLLKQNPEQPVEALQTLWWALLNSNEFILDH